MADQPHGILEDIGAEIGYTATCALVDWFGGRSLYIPEVALPGHEIERAVGRKAFERLVKAWGGETIGVPLDHAREMHRRDRAIGVMLSKGMAEQQIANVMLLSLRQVQNIRRRLEEASIIPLIIRDPDARKRAAYAQGQMTIYDALGGDQDA